MRSSRLTMMIIFAIMIVFVLIFPILRLIESAAQYSEVDILPLL